MNHFCPPFCMSELQAGNYALIQRSMFLIIGIIGIGILGSPNIKV